MRIGPFVIAEKGVAFGICDRNGEGIGVLYNRVEASGARFEPSRERGKR